MEKQESWVKNNYVLGLQPEDNQTSDKEKSVVSHWGVEDIQNVYSEFIKLRATENEKPYNVGGELMTATVKDPWGM